ncbi:hypothetical protein FRB99_007336 [Tulasnella sp. 403]|nr:hypothetical protein FRB99_007336 [Tulasnella sp. 403]
MGGLLPESNACASPEVKSGGWSALKSLDPACADAYALGLLLHAVFNAGHPPPPTIFPPHPPPPPSSRGSIPPAIFPSFRRLLNPNPKTRFTAKAFLDLGLGEKPGDGAGFFASNGLYKVCSGLDGFPLASDGEKSALLRTLKESASAFPTEFATYKVLPSLLSSMEHGGASAAQVLPLVLQFAKNLSPSEYMDLVIGPLVKLFGSPDRGTRMALLDNLSEYADKLDNRIVTEKVWPSLQTGFGDTVAVIREATLSDRVLNNDLLRHLAKSQTDPEASIRTNTCILLGRIAPSLSYNTKRKVLVPAFTRSLKDGFVHARVAGLMALMATIECFEVEELASKVIPCMSFCLLDKEKLVRDQAFKAMELFLKRIESHAATMPESASAPENALSAALPAQAGIANSAAGAAGALAGWAMSSISKKLATSDLQTTIGGGGIGELPSLNGNATPKSTGFSPLGQTPAIAVTSPFDTAVNGRSAPKPKGMQLGHRTTASLADEVAAEAAAAVPGAWDDVGDDLMDVAADAGDWSEFASAPDAPQMEAVHDPEAWGDMLDGSEQKTPSPPPQVLPNLSSFAPAPRKAAIGGSSKTRVHAPVPKSAPKQTSSPPVPVRGATSPALPVTSPSPTPRSSTQLNRPTDANGWDDSDSNWKVDDAVAPAQSSASAPLAGMSKEEKAAEMARRREERKQRIAQLKEQKKVGGKG